MLVVVPLIRFCGKGCLGRTYNLVTSPRVKLSIAAVQRCPSNSYHQDKKNKLKTMKIDNPSFHAIFTEELKSLVDLFARHRYELRIAGGAVRDILMDKQPSDIDFATTATPQQMQAMFQEEGIRMINNRGEKHGTVTCRLNDKENFEVTTLRIDVTTDGRHAEVKFTTDWQLDAERRDLTINSMFLGFDGTLYDYYDGYRDLAERKVCFVGSPKARIQEDYLRILRYFRFFGRISPNADSHDADTLKSIRDNADGLAAISGERIWVEVKKILMGRHVPSIMRLIYELGVAKHLGFPVNGLLDDFERVYDGCHDLQPLPMTLLSALMSTDDQVETLNKRIKMSRDEQHLGLFIIQHRHDDIGDDRLLYCQHLHCDTLSNEVKTLEKIHELLKYRNLRETLALLAKWQPKKFPVSGFKLAELGVARGPMFARVLSELRAKWKNSAYNMTEADLLDYLKQNFAKLTNRQLKDE